jgi:Spy/CpxP family protein refolding chaperone
MDKKVLVIILVISVAINAATLFTFGYFWWTRHSRFERPELLNQPHVMYDWQHTRIARNLNLSKEQIEEIKKMNEEIRSEMWPIREELFKKRQELTSLLREKEPDSMRVDRLLKEIAAMQAEHENKVFHRILKIREILTTEQQEQLGGLLHKFMEECRPPEPPHVPAPYHRPFRSPRGEGGQ